MLFWTHLKALYAKQQNQKQKVILCVGNEKKKNSSVTAVQWNFCTHFRKEHILDPHLSMASPL